MGLLDRWRRPQELPAAWRKFLDANIPPCRTLPAPVRETFERHVRGFLAGKRFEGCRGLEVTDEMRLTVAGYAALLLAGNRHGSYPRLGTVVIYPQSFAAPIRATGPAGIVTETVEERLGESWQEGTVVLAWDSIEEVVRGLSNDCNVIIHEFAHQIDAEHGLTAGAPLLALRDRFRDWQDLLEGERQRQRRSRRRGRPFALDPYAFTHVEELFAVASESFFMRPVRFRSGHPELYAELQAVYRLDPAGWLTKPC